MSFEEIDHSIPSFQRIIDVNEHPFYLFIKFFSFFKIISDSLNLLRIKEFDQNCTYYSPFVGRMRGFII